MSFGVSMKILNTCPILNMSRPNEYTLNEKGFIPTYSKQFGNAYKRRLCAVFAPSGSASQHDHLLAVRPQRPQWIMRRIWCG